MLIGRKGRGSHKSRTEERFRKTKFITLTGLGRRHSRRASDGQRLRAEAAHGSSGRLSGEFFKDGILRRL